MRRRTLPGMVTHTDEMIGDVIRSLKQHKRWDDTLVLFSAECVTPHHTALPFAPSVS